jgi:NAD(P)-dependent dehydrogenase (short-subunit alcohol dehydrogenase family)
VDRRHKRAACTADRDAPNQACSRAVDLHQLAQASFGNSAPAQCAAAASTLADAEAERAARIKKGGVHKGRTRIKPELLGDSHAVAFLASRESGFVTAQVITVDSGRMDYIGHG